MTMALAPAVATSEAGKGNHASNHGVQSSPSTSTEVAVEEMVVMGGVTVEAGQSSPYKPLPSPLGTLEQTGPSSPEKQEIYYGAVYLAPADKPSSKPKVSSPLAQYSKKA